MQCAIFMAKSYIKMKGLHEIAASTSSKSMRKILSGSSVADAKSSKIGRLYKFLREAKLDEATVVKELYGNEVDASDPRYKTLKSRLKRLMLNSLLNAEATSGGYNTYDEAYVTGFQQLSLAKLLTVKRAYRAAEEVATYAFRNVRHYEIMKLNEGFTDILSSLYLGILYNPKLFKKYYELHEYYLQGYIDNNIVARKYRLMRSKMYAPKENSSDVGPISLEFVEEVKDLMYKYPKVPSLQAMIRTTQVMGLKLTGNYKQALGAADEAESVLSKCKGVSSLVVSAIALTRVECSLHLRDYAIGVTQVEKTRPMIPRGTINAIKLSEYAVLLGLQTQHYDYSYTEIQSLDRKTLNKLPSESMVEIWYILEAYIRMLILAGKIQANPKDERTRKFRLAKFRNNVQENAANKRGTNIQIIVVQAMFYILRNEQSKFIDRTEALSRYCTRYLKDNENIRHNCFFKLLIEVVKGHFRLDTRRKRIRMILERMTSKEAIEMSKNTNSEIVPYEALWEILTEHLQKSSVKVRAQTLQGGG